MPLFTLRDFMASYRVKFPLYFTFILPSNKSLIVFIYHRFISVITSPGELVLITPSVIIIDFLFLSCTIDYFRLLSTQRFNLSKPSGFFTYRQVLTFKNSIWPSLCVECFVRISEQTATFALYIINWLVFITIVECVYCAVRTDSLYKVDYVPSLKG